MYLNALPDILNRVLNVYEVVDVIYEQEFFGVFDKLRVLQKKMG